MAVAKLPYVVVLLITITDYMSVMGYARAVQQNMVSDM
jgi:hypothetical protein